jgi:CBS domain-containing protein
LEKIMKAIYVSSRQPFGIAEELARRSVTGVMSSPVASVSEDMLLGDALRVMVRLRHRHLVVVDGDGRCVGILADRAVASAWAEDPTSLSVRPVRSALPKAPALVGAQAKVLDVARLMRSAGADAVAVVDGTGQPMGIVTGTDLVALLTG